MSRDNANRLEPSGPVDESGAAPKDAGVSIVYVRPKAVRLARGDLAETGSLILWALRTWVRGFMKDVPVARSIVGELRCARAGEIFDELDGLMALYGRHARRRLDFRCPRCDSLSPDEYGFLLLIGAAQAGLKDLVRAIAREGLEPSAVPRGVLRAGRLAATLRAGGIELPLPASGGAGKRPRSGLRPKRAPARPRRPAAGALPDRPRGQA